MDTEVYVGPFMKWNDTRIIADSEIIKIKLNSELI